MRQKLIATLFALFIFPVCNFAITLPLPVNTLFNQQAIVINNSLQNILVTDDAMPEFSNRDLAPTYVLTATYPADKFTNPKGQTFSHTIKIASAADNKLICTATRSLELTATSMHTTTTSSDPAKCEVTSPMSFSANGALFIFRIIVK